MPGPGIGGLPERELDALRVGNGGSPMAGNAGAAHHRVMDPTFHNADRPPPLRRARTRQLVAGVCAGLADYFDLDIVLVRVLVVGLALVAGIGLPLYLAAWLLVPEDDTDESIAERLLWDVRPRGGPMPARAQGAGSGGSQHAEAR
ncbi:MAG: PspC domain-containing protein [Acidimicrobiales bacterium]